VIKEIRQIHEEALEALAAAKDEKEIDSVVIRFLGRKGALTGFLRNIAQLPPEERAAAGKQANTAKRSLEAAVQKAREDVQPNEKAHTEWIDISLPGRRFSPGHAHPISQVTQEICGILERMGFSAAEGPEVETDVLRFGQYRSAHPDIAHADQGYGKPVAAGGRHRPGQGFPLRFRSDPYPDVSPG
jgi:phenylalanyl-tRNA synthetase alpha chain